MITFRRAHQTSLAPRLERMLTRAQGLEFMAAAMSSSREEAAEFMTPVLKAAPASFRSVQAAEAAVRPGRFLLATS